MPWPHGKNRSDLREPVVLQNLRCYRHLRSWPPFGSRKLLRSLPLSVLPALESDRVRSHDAIPVNLQWERLEPPMFGFVEGRGILVLNRNPGAAGIRMTVKARDLISTRRQ